MVLDLRGDPGGLLDEAVETASVFLDGGVVVTYARRDGPTQLARPGSQTFAMSPQSRPSSANARSMPASTRCALPTASSIPFHAFRPWAVSNRRSGSGSPPA